MINKIGKGLYSLATLVTAFCLGIMAILVFVNVVLRYVFNSGITWSSEMSQFMFVWLVFLGAVLAYKDNAHLNVDVVVKRLPKKAQFVIHVIAELVFLTILVMLFIGSIRMTAISMQTLSPATHMPMGYVYGIGIILSLGIGMMLVSRLIKTIVDFSNGRDARFNDLPNDSKETYTATEKLS